MRINEYESFEEFKQEYYHDNGNQSWKYIGIEFIYKFKNYRMCFEPIGDYYLYSYVESKESDMPDFTTIGVYKTFDELLSSTAIDSKPFKDVIMDDDTKITSKD